MATTNHILSRQRLTRCGLVSALCTALLSACGSFSYVSNDRLRMMDVLSPNESGQLYGAIVMRKDPKDIPVNFTSKGGIDDVPVSADASMTAAFNTLQLAENKPERVFVLKRHNGRYMAETMMFDMSNDKHSWFKESYFSFGADQKRNNLGFQLRFVY